MPVSRWQTPLVHPHTSSHSAPHHALEQSAQNLPPHRDKHWHAPVSPLHCTLPGTILKGGDVQTDVEQLQLGPDQPGLQMHSPFTQSPRLLQATPLLNGHLTVHPEPP